MDDHDIAELKQALVDRLAALDEEDARGTQGQRTVDLDQQAVGRLSRMDALQNQAMAKAQAARRARFLHSHSHLHYLQLRKRSNIYHENHTMP